MTWFRAMIPTARTAAALMTGAMVAVALWVVGLEQLAWLGFFASGIWWALPTSPAGPVPASARPAGLLPATVDDVAPGTYDVVSAETTVEVRARKLRHWTVRANLSPVTGAVLVGTTTEASQVRASIPAATFRSGNSRRDVHIIGPQFLDAQRYPHLRYHSQTVRVLGPSLVESVGELAVRGVSRPVTWRVDGITWSPGGSTFRLRARTTIRRSDFGLTTYRWLVGDSVDVDIDLTATRSPAPA